MKIPETLAELRANVAACPETVDFQPGAVCHCLVTAPLNIDIPWGDRYSFTPSRNLLVTTNADSSARQHLPDAIGFIAWRWDIRFGGRDNVTREECLAFIDDHMSEYPTT